MNRRQAQKLNMARATLSVLDRHTDTWSTIPIIQTYRDRLEELVAAVDEAASRQQETSETLTADKAARRREMARQALTVAGAVRAQSADAGEPVEGVVADVTMSDLVYGTGAEDVHRAERVLEDGRERLEALAPYGVTAEDMDALEASIDAFAEALATPRSAIAQRRVATETVAASTRDLMALLYDRLDHVLVRFAGTEFHLDYQAAREIVG